MAVRILLENGPRLGLELSTEDSVPGESKSAVWCPMNIIDDANNSDPLGLGIKPIVEDGFVHLGAPVGSQHYVELKVRE